MKLLGSLLAIAAVAAVVPYRVEKDPEDGSISAKGLIYDFKLTKDENGESNVDQSFNLKKFKKKVDPCAEEAEKTGEEEQSEDTEKTDAESEAEPGSGPENVDPDPETDHFF